MGECFVAAAVNNNCESRGVDWRGQVEKSKEENSPGGELVNFKVTREPVAADKFVTLYVNDTQIQYTPWDIRFLLGVIETLATPENPRVVVKQLGEIRMSPQHAKRFAQVLTQQLSHYE